MTYEFHYTPTGTGVISGKEVLEQTEDAINDLSGQISGDVQTAIDTANNALNTANTASVDAQNAINTANTAYTAATNAQNTANTAQNTASNALTAAQNAQNDVNALGNRVTTAENNISQNTSDISGLTTRMGTAEGNIGNLQTAVSNAQATANSAQQTAATARQQSYVFRYSGTAVVPNSTIAYSTIDNTDNIKSGDKILDVNGKLFEITAVDTTNQTVTVGSALVDLALDANVMHLSGDETAAGKKIFSEYITSDGSYMGDEYSANTRTNLWLMGNRDTEEVSGILFDTYRQNTSQGTGSHILGICMKENSVRYEGCGFTWAYDNDNNGYAFTLRPTTQGTNQPIKYDLGSSLAKWTTINGINPSALGMPDTSNRIDISGYLTNLSKSLNTYTPPVNGWIEIELGRSALPKISLRCRQTDGLIYSTETSEFSSWGISFPVVGGKGVSIYLYADSLNKAGFYPCLGNV